MLNASVLVARAAMRVYLFHSRQFCAPVMNLFFCPHDLYEDITLDDIRPPFHPPRYPTDEEPDSDTWLTPTYSMESDPSKPSYPTYSMESYRLEPSHPSVIHLSLDSSTSSTTPAPSLIRGHGIIRTYAVPRRHRHA